MTPTPAQLAKARAIAVKVRERAIDFSLGTDLGRHLLSDDAALTAIARALADEAQQGQQAGLREARIYITERWGELAQRRKRSEDSEARNRLRVRQEEMERADDRLRQLAEEGPSR